MGFVIKKVVYLTSASKPIVGQSIYANVYNFPREPHNDCNGKACKRTTACIISTITIAT